MGPLAKVLLVLALVVPVAAYVAGSLASSSGPGPADRGPVILDDRSTTTRPGPAREAQQGTGNRPERGTPQPGRTPTPSRGGGGSGDEPQPEARVVTPLPTPVGEDDDDEWDDDSGPEDDDETDDSERDD